MAPERVIWPGKKDMSANLPIRDSGHGLGVLEGGREGRNRHALARSAR